MLVSFTQSVTLLSFSHLSIATPFPAPSGPYGTTLETIQLIDNNRNDTFSPSSGPRKLMISLFTPVAKNTCNPIQVPYLDSQTASFQDQKFSVYGLPPGLFGTLELSVCSSPPKKLPRPPKTPQTQHPLIVLSPALATTRLFYNVLAQQIASEGYVVVSIDHPYDVDIVTFPDNTTILGIDIPDYQLPIALNTRVKDISFVINQIARPSFARKYYPTLSKLGCGGTLDVSQVGIIGHSFGGAAAAEAMLNDKRIVAGVNLDGTFFGDVVTKGLQNPFMIFAHDGKNRTNDPSWEAIWPRLKGWKRELTLKGAAHYTFSDLPVIVEAFGIRELLPVEAGELLGQIDGKRAADIVGAYVKAFFGKFLRKEGTKLLDGPNKSYPEVVF